MKKLWLASCIFSVSALSHAIDTKISNDSVVFSQSNADTISVSISGPDGYNEAFTTEADFLKITASDINNATDGSYQFDAISTEVLGKTTVDDSNGRGLALKNIVNSESDSGHFRLENGSIVTTQEEE